MDTFTHRPQLHDRVDKLANNACRKSEVDVNLRMSNRTIKNIFDRETHDCLIHERNSERYEYIRIEHYDQFCETQHVYGTHKNNTRNCDTLTARI